MMTILRWILWWINRFCKYVALMFGKIGLWAEAKYQVITEMGKA